MLIGRTPDADILLRMGTVSRRHALVRVVDEKVLIEDLGSRNGIFVGLKKVGAPNELRNGDHITIGDISVLKIAWLPIVAGAIRSVAAAPFDDTAPGEPRKSRFIEQLRAEDSFARHYDISLVLCFFRAPGLSEDQSVRARDEAMHATAAIVRQGMQADDLIVRAGQDELLVLFRGSPDRAADMAARVCARVHRAARASGASLPAEVTAALVPLAHTPLLAPETIVTAAQAASRAAMNDAGASRIVTLPRLAIQVASAPRPDRHAPTTS